jgi:hypothetical protein
MAIESWIDEVCKVWATLEFRKKTFVKSYPVFSKDGFPEDLSEFPCALTYVQEANMNYSLGGPCRDIYIGQTELHLVGNTQKKHYADILRFYKRIRDAAAASLTLNGKVKLFALAPTRSIQGPVTMQWGSEAEHLGLIVRWTVKEDSSGQFTIGS